jgi:glycosyltransferase involved in cell wall biosynthesis
MDKKRKIKVCHITSFLKHSLLMEAIGGFLDKDKYEVSFVFLNPDDTPLPHLLAGRGHHVEIISYAGRRHLPRAIVQLRKIFRKMRPDIVHAHLADASIAGMIAARLSGIEDRVHTRHHSTECHVYYPHGVYYDKLVNRLSKQIVAPTQIVKETLVEKEGVDPRRITLIHHGYDLTEFDGSEAGTAEIRAKYGLDGSYPVIGVISRFVEWKGVQFIIPAFARLLKQYPKAKLVMANAAGNYTDQIDGLLEKELAPHQYLKIGFEEKVFDLCRNFDVFVHVPIRRDAEAFGQTYIEALYSKLPSIFTFSGVAHEFIRDRENALVVPYADAEAIYDALSLVLSDDRLREKIALGGQSDVRKRFNGRLFGENLDRLYSQL